MEKMKLVVEVHARFVWLEPSANVGEEAIREYASNMASAAGKQLEPAVQLLVAEILSAKMPNA